MPTIRKIFINSNSDISMRAYSLTLICGFLCLVLLCVSGCGYTFQGSGSILPPDVKKIYIPIVENNSTETTLGPLLTEALRDRFDRYGAVTVVDDLSSADAVLKTKVVKIKKGVSSSSSRTDSALERNTTLVISAELQRTTGQYLWRNPQFSISQTYGSTRSSVVTSSSQFATGSLNAEDLEGLGSREVSRGQEQEALSDLAEEAARKVYEEAVAPDF